MLQKTPRLVSDAVCEELIGCSLSGYEKYNSMRADPVLHFLEKVGSPDPKAVAAEQGGADLATDGAEG